MTVRQKKIRGHNRRHNQIENWRLDNLSFDLTYYLQNNYDRFYAKISVHPWNSRSMTNSVIPQPRGKTKQKMLCGLLDIYENWKNKLDKLEQPYYLKIWLFDNRFSQSQVVCAIGENVNFYENTFYKPDTSKTIPLDNYGTLKTRLSRLNWDYHLDEDQYDNTYIGEQEIYASIKDYEEDVRWFNKLLKKPHRTTKFKKPYYDVTEFYSFKRGDLWLGHYKNGL